MKRYDEPKGDHQGMIRADGDGCWVWYDDAEAELSALRARVGESEILVAALRRSLDKLHDQRSKALELAEGLSHESEIMTLLSDVIASKSPDIKASGTAFVQSICAILQEWLQQNGAQNYCELVMGDSGDMVGLTFTVRRNDRPTPHTLRAKAEAERDAALSRIATLEAPPVVPEGWEAYQADSGEWYLNCDHLYCGEVGPERSDQLGKAQALRALAWAIEHDQRPPHASDGKEGGE